MEFPVIISFYTKNTPYQLEIQNLIASCEAFDLEIQVEGVESFGTWELNCAYKPFFILKTLDELQMPLLWVDADGVFVQKPTWQEAFQSDLSVRYHSELPKDHPSKVISSTIFVAPTPQARHLLKMWIKECQKSLLDPNRKEEFWDQMALRDAILQKPPEITVSSLPLTYAKIFDHPQDCKEVASPVIEHYQASRRSKKFINL